MVRLRPRFVDRVWELRALERLAERGSPVVVYIYGPEGCGKTRLLREFISRFDGVGVYVDALEERSPERAVVLSPTVKSAWELVRSLVEQAVGSVGRWVCTRLSTLVQRVATRIRLRGERVVIAVDDVTRALGVDETERYVKWLYELIGWIAGEYEPESILVIATTSEGYSLDRVVRHTYNTPNLLWNLDEDGFRELVDQLNPPRKSAREELWRLTGGNPRAAIEVAMLYGWDSRAWMLKLEEELRRIASLVRARGLVGEVLQLVEDPDALEEKPSPRLLEAYRLLVEHNLFMYTGISLLASWAGEGAPRRLEACPELGVGRYYSWQMPVYRSVLASLLKA